MYNKRFVFDIDNTISFTTNRDWINAKPNLPIIEKINKLYNDGWEIFLHTARGSISAPDTADEKYRSIIEIWMKTHNVQYHKLIFGKPLGAYYVDDKALTPDDFLSLEIEDLKGMSGATIFRAGDQVHKTADNTENVIKWFEVSKSSSLCTPKIHMVVGETISMEYIKENCEIDYEILLNQLEKNSRYLHQKIPDFTTYIKRVESHNQDKKYLTLLEEYSEFYNKNKSFCHGDASIDNILCKDNTLYFIDPIYLPDVYSSWLLDISKTLCSLKRFDKNDAYRYILDRYSDIKTELQVLELSHWIRMVKYHSYPQEVKNEMECLYESIKN
jgi:capsule biosynthesis phosphatase